MVEKLRTLYADNLFKNSFYLMLNTGVQAALGFIFWIISAHFFTPDQIGIAASLISAMTLISYFSLLGFNTTFIRFLPNSANRDKEINTGLLLSISAAFIIGIVYVLIVPYIAPRLGIIHENIFYAAGFIILVALAAINLLTDSIFVAFRGAQYNLLIDGGIMGTIKMLLPLVFVGLGAYGVFLASGSAAAVAMVASIFFLATKFDYRPRLSIDKETLGKVFHYSFSSYVSNLFSMIPTLVLPILIIDRLGAAESGYYYLAFAVANLLYAIAFAVSQSFFAEGSYAEVALWKLFKRSLLILGAIMIPAATILAILGPFVLEVFGKSYITGGSQVVVILSLAAPAVAAYAMGSTLLRIGNRIYAVVTVNLIYLLSICTFAFLWVGRGLVWVAIAWLLGNVVTAIVSFLFVLYSHWRAVRKLSV